MSTRSIPSEVFAGLLRPNGVVTPEIHWCSGGLSGAWVGRVDTNDGQLLCIRRWPIDTPPERIAEIHQVLRAVRHFNCLLVPELRTNEIGETFVKDVGGQHWELAQWISGEPVSAPAGDAILRVAGAALAELHLAMSSLGVRHAVAPNCLVRIKRLDELSHAIPTLQARSIQLSNFELGNPLQKSLLFRAFNLWQQAYPLARCRLLKFATQTVPIHYVLRDIHRGHLLCDAERVCGFIDFDAVRIDTPMTDLARLCGSLGGSRSDALTIGFDEYDKRMHVTRESWLLAEALDFSTSLASMMTWLEWIIFNNVPGNLDVTQANARLIEHLSRVESLLRFTV